MMNHHVSGHFPKPNAKAAVSVVIRDNPPSIGANDVRYFLKERLPFSVHNPNSIVECRLHRRIGSTGSEYYVELSTPNFRRRLLELDGVEMTCNSIKIRPTIRPWERDQPSSPSQPSRDVLNQHQYQPSAQEAEATYRPSKRPREHNSIFEPRSPESPPKGIRRQSSSSVSTSSKNSSQMSHCTLALTKNPQSFSPKSFQDYLNSHLSNLKLAGVLDDADGKPPIQRCYESTTANTVDGWVLETRTAKIADSIMNSVSGKLVVEGTRLYFQRSRNLSTDGRTMSSPSTHRDGNRKSHAPSSLKTPSMRVNKCKVFVSMLPKTKTRHEFCNFVNASIRNFKLYDGDVVCDSSMTKSGVCVLLCPSPDLAQCVVDELDSVTLDGLKLTLRRHKLYQKLDRAAGNKTNKIVPSSTVRRVSVSSETLPNAIPNTTSPNTSSEESVSETVETNKSAAETEIAKLKAANENLTNQAFKLLKENQELQKNKENLEKEVAASKEKEAVDSETNKKKYDDLKRKHDEVSSELENLHTKKMKVDKELVVVKKVTKTLQNRLENQSKKGEIDDYEKRLYDIHESWKEQGIQIQDQGEEIDRLKAVNAKEAKEKEELQARLTEKEQKYQNMTDALVNMSAVLNEEKAIRKQLQQTLVEFRKKRKKAEKMLKAYQQANGLSEEHSDSGDAAVKPEDQYDF